MARRQAGLSERKRRILEYLNEYQERFGFPPSIREIGEKTGITSTSVVNYYLEQLEQAGYIERESHISRGLRLVRMPDADGSPAQSAGKKLAQAAKAVATTLDEMLRIPVIGRIGASYPMPVPPSDFTYYDPESGIDLARSLLPAKEKLSELFALEVQGDSMIDAMVNDGDIVIMRRANAAKNGEMVAVWLNDRDETTLKYFFAENGRVRLQPANPTMKPIIIEDPNTVQVQGKVVMVIRRVQTPVL
ncbi:MAG TPA: transcriptional repressor LexA [Anaerolineaceae bacterium]|jgi:repressor LexA|nr:transcriptional repressor LexA [Anaerolineaceae bacterium]